MRTATSIKRQPLIITNRGDHTADWLIIELRSRGAPFVRFNTEDYPARAGITWRTDRAHCLRILDQEYSLDHFPAVWYRRPVSPEIPGTMEPDLRGWAIAEARDALEGLWRTHEALWINHPDSNRLASSKQEQLQTASSMGFSVPETVVTSSQEVVREFAATQEHGIVCKPLRWGRVPTVEGEQLFFTSKLSNQHMDHLDRLGSEPYLFQEFVEKDYDVRVTVIGRTAFSARIESQLDEEARVDWRRKGGALTHRQEELPRATAQLCVDLVEHYGLQFGAIDLARRPDGSFVFFEINPNGQWAWVEQLTGLPLRARLADLLLSPC